MDFSIFDLSPLPLKRRKMVPELPRRYSDLMAAFGAQKTPTSSRRMVQERAAYSVRSQGAPVSYAESEDSQMSFQSASSFEDGKDVAGDSSGEDEHDSISDNGDELHADDIIHAVPRGTGARLAEEAAQRAAHLSSNRLRQVPPRATKALKSYAQPSAKKKPKILKPSPVLSRKPAKPLLRSDTEQGAELPKGTGQTARTQVRTEIATNTKPKRDAYLLANKDYFQPLLPDNSYIRKLERRSAMSDGNEPTEVTYVPLSQQPEGVKATMKPYQLEGLSFLVHMHENGMSAILGDEMGLGKTLQTLALFQYLANRSSVTVEHRPHLVVCPLSVLSSWLAEARKWVPELHVIRFHGPKAERDRFKQDCLQRKSRSERHGKSKRDVRTATSDRIDVVITTYETFTAEQSWLKRAFVWRYCVLDEGHKIKNDKSDIASALQGLGAEYRLLLTGTPLQNNLHEMWALLHWLFPEVFTLDTADGFKQAFDLTKGKVSTTFMDAARRLLELIMLRRLKSSPGINLGLPPKEEILLFVPLTPMQRFWYVRLLTKTDMATIDDLFAGAKAKAAKSLKQERMDEQLALLEKAGIAADVAEEADNTMVWAESRAIIEEALQNEEVNTKSSGWRKLMNLLIQLRKVCSHPYLLPSAMPMDYQIGEHVKTASGKFIVLDKLIEELVVRQEKKILIFSGFTKTLDLCEDLLMLKGANTYDSSFRYARLDGSTARAQRNLSIRMFNDTKSDFKVMLISTRAGGLGINLTSATDVVFMDEDWNPQVTLQAEARAHRIGQTKKVTIYKLCTQGTVEEQMMGRIRKKLYLSAKVMESMRNLHAERGPAPGKKRKRSTNGNATDVDDAPQLDTASLQSLIRRGAQTLARPEIDVTEMLDWDWETTLDRCKDQPMDALISEQSGQEEEKDEQTWLNTMEKVETAVFEGRKHQKQAEKQMQQAIELNPADRRNGKNTTVEIGGFMINKESLQCADWEAVPTFAGKDPRLAEPKREKREAIRHQDHCQCCWNGGDVILCSGCPRVYHVECMESEFQVKAKGRMNFHCSQHQCRDCGARTAEAGGLIYRCRWCENGFCEDCLDWEKVVLTGDTLPEFEMLGFGRKDQAHYIECPHCIDHWKDDRQDRVAVEEEKSIIADKYEKFVARESSLSTGAMPTPDTMSEVATPVGERALHALHMAKKTNVAEVIDLSML